MKSLRLRQALLAFAAAIALFGPADRTAAAATVVTSCTRTILNTLTVKTCLTVTGSGDFVQSAVARASVLSGDGTLDVELVGPQGVIGSPIDLHSDFKYVPTGASQIIDWCPDHVVQPGGYEAVTRRRNSDGTVTVVGRATVDVPI
jgi:hypothetical protein